MTSIKSIRSQIKSVQNTGKITRAMEMVAASKMKKAQELLWKAKEYSRQLGSLKDDLYAQGRELLQAHPFFVQPKSASRILCIVVSSDKGLCGGLNTNLFRFVMTHIQNYRDLGSEVAVITVGRKAHSFFSHCSDISLLSSIENISDSPDSAIFDSLLAQIYNDFQEEKLKEVHVFYNIFVSRMVQKPGTQMLFPSVLPSQNALQYSQTEYLIEPDLTSLFDKVFQVYIQSLVMAAIIENIACEQCARMISMKAASDNVKEMVDRLRLDYNRGRQASITKELAEIVGGSAAIV